MRSFEEAGLDCDPINHQQRETEHMAGDHLPPPNGAFDAWQANFVNYATANATARKPTRWFTVCFAGNPPAATLGRSRKPSALPMGC